jgi:MarR family transcriptional regulator, organic hydroperoxide resistance regulator
MTRRNRQAVPAADSRTRHPDRASRGARLPNQSRSAQQIAADDAKLRIFMADMYAAMSLMRLLRQEIASALSLSSAEYSVLLAVWYLERGDDLTLRAIADHLHVAAANVTAEVGRLTDKGLLTKRPDPMDRRAISVELTPASRKLLAPLAPLLRDVNAPLLAGISLKDLDAVHRFFRGIIANGDEAINVARTHRHSLNERARERPAPRAPIRE